MSTNNGWNNQIANSSRPVAFNGGPTISSTGIMTNSKQPAFYAYQSTSPSNVTGDGTVYTLALDTAVLNQGSYFDATTFIFTCPITGFYQFNMAALFTSVGVQTTLQLQVSNETAGIQYNGAYANPTTIKAVGNFLGQNMACAIHCTSGDNIKFKVILSGSTLTVGIDGSDGLTFASGYLVC